MKSDTIGVALTKCFWCGQNDKIVMNTRLIPFMAEKVKEMHGKAIDKEPCNQCKEYMKAGVILITVDEKKSEGDMNNPYRTGGWFVVKDKAIKRLGLKKETEESLLMKRVGFIGHEVAEMLGLFKAGESAVYKSKDEFNAGTEQ